MKDRLSEMSTEKLLSMMDNLSPDDQRSLTRYLHRTGRLEIPKSYESYMTWEDSKASVKKWDELSQNEKRRSTLFSLADIGEISNEQFTSLIDDEEAADKFLFQYVQDMSIDEYVEKFGEDSNSYLNTRLSALLDEYWIRSITPKQLEILSKYPEDYYQLQQVLGKVYDRRILEEEEAPQYIYDILLIDEIDDIGLSEQPQHLSMDIMLFRDMVRDKILLHPEIDKVFDWIGATKEKHLKDKDSYPADSRLEYETVIWKKGSPYDLDYDEREKIQEILLPESQTFTYGVNERFSPERISAWQRGSEQFKKYLDIVGQEGTDTYYHVTPMSNLENILREGLIRGKQSILSTFLGYRSRTGIFVVDLSEDSLGRVLEEAHRLKRNIPSWAVLEVQIPSDCYMTVDPKMLDSAWIAFCDVPPSGVKFIREVRSTNILEEER